MKVQIWASYGGQSVRVDVGGATLKVERPENAVHEPVEVELVDGRERPPIVLAERMCRRCGSEPAIVGQTCCRTCTGIEDATTCRETWCVNPADEGFDGRCAACADLHERDA